MTFQILKRATDVFISLALLFLMLPVMSVIFIIISMDGGPLKVFFLQKRVGKGGHPFTMYKFRTLTLIHSNKNSIGHADEDLIFGGKFLRKFSLDELPQLINVLMGNMSLVGPRPLPLEYASYIEKCYPERNNVNPGLVCFTHLYGRNLLNWKNRFRLDTLYVKSNDIFTDLYVLSQVPFIILKGQGNILSSNLIKE